MIALSGIFCGLIIGIIVVWRDTRDKMPTQQDENDLTNKLNRMALDRANERNSK